MAVVKKKLKTAKSKSNTLTILLFATLDTILYCSIFWLEIKLEMNPTYEEYLSKKIKSS